MKVHTRVKRMAGVRSRRFRHRFFFGSIKKKNRPKTFKTEGSARKYAEKKKLKTEDYSLIKAKKNKKFQIKLLKEV